MFFKKTNNKRGDFEKPGFSELRKLISDSEKKARETTSGNVRLPIISDRQTTQMDAFNVRPPVARGNYHAMRVRGFIREKAANSLASFSLQEMPPDIVRLLYRFSMQIKI